MNYKYLLNDIYMTTTNINVMGFTACDTLDEVKTNIREYLADKELAVYFNLDYAMDTLEDKSQMIAYNNDGVNVHMIEIVKNY